MTLDSLNRWLMLLPPLLEKTVHTTTTFDQLRLIQSDIEQHPVEYQKLILHVENLARQPSLKNQKITRENKESYRPFLQWLGGYLVKKVRSRHLV